MDNSLDQRGNWLCPNCNSDKKVRNGLSRGKQRFRCQICGHTFSRQSSYARRQSLVIGQYLYQQGYSLRRIGQLLRVSHATVRNWLKKDLGEN